MKKRVFFLVVLFVVIAVAMTGCKKAKLRSQLKELMGSTIVLPDRITCVYNGEVFQMPDSLRKKAKLIVFVDSSECHACKLSQLSRYDRLSQLADATKKFEFLFMLGNTHFGRITLVQYLSDLDLSFPVYVDEACVFLGNNSIIPSESIFHSFFLNSDDKILFVGDPILNERVMSLLERTLAEDYH